MAVETKVEDRLSNEAKHLLKDRYLWRNERGKIVETPAEMFRRVAREVNLAEIRHGSGDM